MSQIERYRFNHDLRHYFVGPGEKLVRVALSDSPQLSTENAVLMLGTCQSFASLEEHAARMERQLKIPSVQRANVMALLEQSARTGILVSESALMAQLSATDVAEQNERITTLCFPTKDRPDSLKRCLSSFGECLKEFGRSVRILVADQSEGENSRQNAVNLAEFAQRFGLEVVHKTAPDARLFSRQLADQLQVPLETVQFGLVNDLPGVNGIGCNRNLLLLLTVGELVVQIDDDTICRLLPAPEFEEGLVLTSDPANEYYFAEPEQKFELTDDFVMGDFLGLHEQLLGKTVGQCVRSAVAEHTPISFDAARATFFRKLSGDGGRVVSTRTGSVGISCRSPWQYFIITKGRNRERLVASEELYRYAQRSQQVKNGTDKLTIRDTSISGAMNTGLDNRQLLPPFMPIMRGEDTVFNYLLSAVLPGGYFGALPWLLFHDAAGPRTFGTVEGAAPISFDAIILAVLALYRSRVTPITTSVEQRFRDLGSLFCEIGQMPHSEFNELLRLELWRAEGARITAIETGLREHRRQPKFWADDLERYARECKARLLQPHFTLSRNVLEAFGPDAAAVKQQQLIGQLGQLLEIWPEMRRVVAGNRGF